MTSRHFLFIHGGPAFNSFAEKALLEPEFLRIGVFCEFWNEPSKLRPGGDPFFKENAFSNWTASIARALDRYRAQGKKVHLIGHSYSANAIVRVLDPYSDVVSNLTIISPALNIYDCYKNIALIGERLFQSTEPLKTQAIAVELASTKSFFDSHQTQSIVLTAEHPLLFTQYWENEAQRLRAVEATQSPEAQFDFDSFMSVNADLASQLEPPRMLEFDRPVQIIFGEKDPIVKVEQETPFLKATFKNMDFHVFKKSRHYSHLEEIERFISTISTIK